MATVTLAPARGHRIAFDLLMGSFLMGLLLIILLPPGSSAGSPAEPAGGAAARLLPMQGTTFVTTVSGSITASDAAFTGPRHFRSGIISDRRCQTFGVTGTRRYDEASFANISPVAQRVMIIFRSGCGFNTYMAAYSPQFNPADICANFIGQPGTSGSVTWEFTVCANTQFSIVVYGLEPGLTCAGYSYDVYGDSIVPLPGAGTSAASSEESVAAASVTAPAADEEPQASDATVRRLKKRNPATDTKTRFEQPRGVSPPINIALPVQSTPLVASITDSISLTEPTFTGPRHFRSGFPGDPNCLTTPPDGTRHYDQFFFVNTSPSYQTVTVEFTTGCATETYAAAYSPQFDPSNICANYLAGAGASGSVTWSFRVCPNSQFSIVVYNTTPGVGCPSYNMRVLAEGVAFPGDVAVTKTGPAGPVAAGSNITYAITVTNNSQNASSLVTLTDPLPAGTTFVSLAPNYPGCNSLTPGAGGTLQCSIGTLGTPGSALPNSLTLNLTVNVTPQAGPAVKNTATVTLSGIDTNPANNSASVTTSITGAAALCVQDDATGAILSINTQTGAYTFRDCKKGITQSGTGTVTVQGCKISFQAGGSSSKGGGGTSVSALIDTCLHTASATVRVSSSGQTVKLSDSNTSNNTCLCP